MVKRKSSLVWRCLHEWFHIRGTHQTVSVNICSEDLLSRTIFGLKYDEKTGVFLCSTFRDKGKAMSVVVGEMKMSHFRKGN